MAHYLGRAAGCRSSGIVVCLLRRVLADPACTRWPDAHVHVNTVRYRPRRFEELTGMSLDAADTVVELSWAMTARELRTPPQGPAAPAP
ncbi:helix-turn-helix domain-containing protein [Streptomyces collinus]|uniref:helix-turn-helix domain-containing protein n=1 Tax=Streptomyces collinus TaxID=42684 RepID=UPI0037B50A4D